MISRPSLFVILTLLCAGCATNYGSPASTNRGVADQKRLKAAFKNGITFNELKEQGFPLTNCRGQPQTPTSCNMESQTGYGMSLFLLDGIGPTVAPYDSRKAKGVGERTVTTIFFTNGKVSSWHDQ